MTPAVFTLIWLLLYAFIAMFLALRLRKDAPDVVRMTAFLSVMFFGFFGLVALTVQGYRGQLSFLIATACVIVGAYFQVKYAPTAENE
jgi:uncharacterized membrane protein